jgi:aquaporin Z
MNAKVHAPTAHDKQFNDTARVALAEVVGTAFLVLGGCGTAVFAGTSVGYSGVAAAFGLSLLIMAYAIGHVSGCHINPAVTLGMVLAKRIDAKLLPVYWVAQLVGGAIGGFILWITFKLSDMPITGGFASNGYGAHSPTGFKLGSVALMEVILTALLIFVVLSTTHGKFPKGFGGIAAGFTLFLIHLVGIPISNTSVNPARSFGVAIFSGESWTMTQLWAFILFPLVGGAIGAAIWAAVQGRDADDDDGPLTATRFDS